MRNRSIASPQGPSPAEFPVFQGALARPAEQSLHRRTLIDLLNLSRKPVLPSNSPEVFFYLVSRDTDPCQVNESHFA